ncbi:MAG: cystathionine beta-lyase [Alphaproteobacteria bacterium]
MAEQDDKTSHLSDAGENTRATHLGRHPQDWHGIVNPPVWHASTVLFPTFEALVNRPALQLGTTTYGRLGTPTSHALEEAWTELEGAAGTVTCSSGLAAISLAFLSVVKAGDHLLVADTVYGPTRHFCDDVLTRMGCQIEYFAPTESIDQLSARMQDHTRLIFCEAPGSQTFEMMDIPAIAALAQDRGLLTLLDNTWAGPTGFKGIAHGVDMVITAGTKHLVGHSDAMLGLVASGPRCWADLRRTQITMGQCAGPDDLYLAARGLRTMPLRLRQQTETGLTLARWLQDHDQVHRVLHPALPGDPGHNLWKRDFTGACGLFGLVLKHRDLSALAAMVDDLRLFGMGYSWGGFESLLLPVHPPPGRTADPWPEDAGHLIRIHAGLEDPDDLISDLSDALDRYAGKP